MTLMTFPMLAQDRATRYASLYRFITDDVLRSAGLVVAVGPAIWASLLSGRGLPSLGNPQKKHCSTAKLLS
jgi:hypothetical protein